MPIMYGAVGAPSSTSAADASNQPFLQGKAAEVVVTELHGKWYTSAYRNRVFLSAGAAAGLSVTISSSTAINFGLYNPLGSGVVAELITLNMGIVSATTVVSPILLGLLTGLTVAPTSITTLASVNANGLAAAAPACTLTSIATLAAAATKFFNIFSISATSGAFPNFTYTFDGHILLQPGSMVYTCGTVGQTPLLMQSLAWAEYPI